MKLSLGVQIGQNSDNELRLLNRRLSLLKLPQLEANSKDRDIDTD